MNLLDCTVFLSRRLKSYVQKRQNERSDKVTGTLPATKSTQSNTHHLDQLGASRNVGGGESWGWLEEGEFTWCPLERTDYDTSYP